MWFLRALGSILVQCFYASGFINLKIVLRVWKTKRKIQRNRRSFFYLSLKKGGKKRNRLLGKRWWAY